MNYEDYFINNKAQKERQKRAELRSLFKDWKEVLKKKADILHPIIKNGRYKTTELFTADGFYPGYFSMTSDKPKVLFMGREGRYPLPGSNNRDRIIFDLDVFINNPEKVISKKTPFGQEFSRLFME